MGFSNFRKREPFTVHHIMNRIAHRVFFLRDEERNDFIEMMRRVAEFTGIQLLGWCVMNNHFHILAYLPERKEVDEAEVVRRVGVLKGVKGSEALLEKLTRARRQEVGGEEQASKLLECHRRRMYDMGSFMKILKQWFTEEYNRRSAHVGTLWESTYIDRAVMLKSVDMSNVLAYICLNPIRGGLCADYDEYAWSSLCAATRGDPLAINGLKFVYGEEKSVAEMVEALHCQMDAVLEVEKRRWAQEVARRRAAGYPVPENPLTDEAYVAQAAAHLEEVVRAGTAFHEQSLVYRKSEEKRQAAERLIVEAMRRQPKASPLVLAKCVGLSPSTAYAYVNDLVAKKIVSRDVQTAVWIINERDLQN